MNIRRHLLLCVLAILGFSTPLLALDPGRALTQYVHRIWQGQQGLPQSTIYCVRQTSDGYLWLGTLTGPVRFDGVRFARMDQFAGANGGPEISLANTPIMAMTQTADGTLWLATDGQGVVGVTGDTARRLTVKEGLPSDRATALLVDSHGDLWIGTMGGAARFSGGHVTTYTMKEGLAANDVRALAQRSDGEIVAAGDSNQLSIFDGKKFQARAVKSLAAGATIQSLAAQDGTLYVGSSAGLIAMAADGEERRFNAAGGLADDFVWCVATSSDGAVWAGTRDGFSRLRLGGGGEMATFHASDGLSQSTVYGIFEDREGSLWVATKHGLNQFLDGRTVPVTMREGLASNDAGPILQDRSGTIWVGTGDAGLSRYDGHHFSTLTTADGLPNNDVTALAEENGGGLWVGTTKGLAELENGRVGRVFAIADGLPSTNVRAVLADREGRLWVGTAAGLALREKGRFAAQRGAHLAEPIVALAQTSGGAVIATTESGVVVSLSADGEKVITTPEIGGHVVDALYADAGGGLWMGTLGGGLQFFDGARTKHFSLRDGLFDDDIFAVVPDAEGRLWMACSKGVFSVALDNLWEFAAGKTGQIVSTPFSPTDALRTVECKSGVEPSACMMADGGLWFATQRGVMILEPEKLPRRLEPPPVVVDEVAVDGRREAPGMIASLPAGRKNLMFRYTGLSYIVPGRITFRYQLEGFDRGWVDAGARREAFYTNLPPGKYRFRVQACNVEGAWTDPGIQTAGVDFALAPAWYQHAWFIPLCILCGLALAGLAFQLRLRTLRHRMQLVLAERSRIARELHDTLLQGFAGVTMEMQALSVRLPANGEKRTLEEIIRDAARCLKDARRSVAGLRDGAGSGGFAALVEKAARELTASSEVSLRVDVGRISGAGLKLPASVEYNLVRIVREAITNALKHSEASVITVALGVERDELVMEVADDGSGFQPTTAAALGHFGLVGMRERAEEIGAIFEIVTGAGKGTVVRVRYGLQMEQPAKAEQAAAESGPTMKPAASGGAL